MNAVPGSIRNPRKWLVVTGILLVLVLFEFLCGMVSGTGQIIAAKWSQFYLPRARAHWESHQITDYTVQVSGYFPLTCISSRLGPNNAITVVVKNGVVAEVEAGYNPRFCPFVGKTIPEIFDWVEQNASGNAIIEYDPEYGFVSRFQYNDCGGNGLLAPIVSDCGGRFGVTNFQPAEK